MFISFRFLNPPKDAREAAWITARKTEGEPFSPRIFSTYLLSEHSVIRRVTLSWFCKDISHRAMTHLVRHVHTQPYVASTRPDWYKGHEKDPTTDVLFDSNCDALISLARKRLCYRAFIDTRKVIEKLKWQMMQGENYYSTLGSFLVPNCIYRAGCPEGSRSCHWWKKFSEGKAKEDLISISKRYNLYNQAFLEEHKNDEQ